VRVLGGAQGLCVHDQPITHLDLGGLGLRRTASTRPLGGSADRHHALVERRRAPQARLTAPSALPPTCIVRDGRLGVSRTGQPAGCHALAVLGNALSRFGLGGGVGTGCLLSSVAGVHDEHTERFDREPSSSVFHFHGANDTSSVPVSRRLLTRTARFFAQEGHRTVLLAPRFSLLPHGTGARDKCDAPNALCEA
jgi:hypothetical protein